MPPHPPWPAWSLNLVVITQTCAPNRCALLWWSPWCPCLRRWPRRWRVIAGQPRVTGVKARGWRWHVGSPCQWLSVQNEFSVFQIWMNSDSFCYFCVELFRVPKIMKIFVWPLCDVYYLRKIWNVVFQYFLNVIKIAQLINKWVSMIFLGLFMYPKIMKIVLPLSYHVMNIYKNFEVNWNKLIYFIILN